ncbi:MAG: AmmeMemoRadiSam system radical SAM enzyme [Magnetococcales bacterium]|nr:AmmeMemoRadiSam system radical SAM enzyme [Magnetococcales bacterium]
MRRAEFWQTLEDGRIQCDVCPRRCRLKEGQQGLCFVRARQDDALVLTTYGRTSGFCVDPIEKKPLYQFLPGSSTFSFGTAGCNLVCKFCQNWHLSKAREASALSGSASPEAIVQAARRAGCASVSFTYNDPVIFLEYAVDVAQACREQGLASVAVTAGYINDAPRKRFFAAMDAANVDLKGFSERFYRQLTGGHLEVVLETLRYLVHETGVWVEITTLLIPGENDDPREIEAMCRWIREELGGQVPLHFTAFHPAWKLMDKPPTPLESLQRARNIALDQGLQHVYTGNLPDAAGSTTWCAGCGLALIRRRGWDILSYALDGAGCCRKCGTRCAGRFPTQAPDMAQRGRGPVRIL